MYVGNDRWVAGCDGAGSDDGTCTVMSIFCAPLASLRAYVSLSCSHFFATAQRTQTTDNQSTTTTERKTGTQLYNKIRQKTRRFNFFSTFVAISFTATRASLKLWAFLRYDSLLLVWWLLPFAQRPLLSIDQLPSLLGQNQFCSYLPLQVAEKHPNHHGSKETCVPPRQKSSNSWMR